VTDAELDALDAFLAEKVMEWRWAAGGTEKSPDGHTLPIAAWLPATGYERGGEWRDRFTPTRDADDAEAVREKWLRGDRPIARELHFEFDGEGFSAFASTDTGPHDYRTADAPSLRLAELLAIARACGWKP
jgi:hypothetical protein